MKDVLQDVIKQTSQLMDVVLITGTAEATTIAGCDTDKSLFVEAKLKKAVPEFEGKFGISNMGILSGLLSFTNFQTDDATFKVHRKTRPNGDEIVEEFRFRNTVTGNSSDFRLTAPEHVTPMAVINEIPWDVVVTPSKSKVSEFQQLANLYAEVDKLFGIRTTDNGDLEFYIGAADSATHRVSMVFASDVAGTLKGELKWSASQFLSVMKLVGNNPATLSITSRAVLSISVETDHGTYAYFIRATR